MPGLRLSGGPSCHRGGRSFAGGLNPKPHLWGPSSPREGPACSQAPPCGRGGAWAVLTAVSAPECPPPSVRWLMAVTDGSGRNPHLCWGQGCEGRRDSGSAAEGPLRARRSPVSASPLRKTHLPRTRPGARGPLPLPLGGRGRGRVGSGRRRRDSPSRPEAFAPPSRVHPRAPAAARQPGERRRCDRWRAAASDSGTSHAPARPPPQARGPGAAPPVAARPEGARTACSPPVNHRVSTQFSERDSREHGLGSPVWRFTDGGSVVGSGVGAVRGCRGRGVDAATPPGDRESGGGRRPPEVLSWGAAHLAGARQPPRHRKTEDPPQICVNHRDAPARGYGTRNRHGGPPRAQRLRRSRWGRWCLRSGGRSGLSASHTRPQPPGSRWAARRPLRRGCAGLRATGTPRRHRGAGSARARGCVGLR